MERFPQNIIKNSQKAPSTSIGRIFRLVMRSRSQSPAIPAMAWRATSPFPPLTPRARPPRNTAPRPRKLKRPPNAFLIFCKQERPSVCERCPGMSPGEISSLLSHLWRSLDAEAKARYKSEEIRLQSEFTNSETYSMPVRNIPLAKEQTPSNDSSAKRLVFKSPAELVPAVFGAPPTPLMPVPGLSYPRGCDSFDESGHVKLP
jgi:hypothetical protein